MNNKHKASHSPWPMVRLGDVCETYNGLWKGVKPPLKNVGVIRATNFTKKCEFNSDNIIFLDVEEKKFSKRKLRYGDLIVERSGGGPEQPVGRIILFDLGNGDYSFSNFTSALRVKQDVDLLPEFLHLYLTSLYFKGETLKIQSNTIQLHNLDFEKYLSFRVPSPPLPAQRKIVARLKKELAEVDRLSAAFKRLVALADERFRSELDAVFKKVKGEKVRLDDVCVDITDGDHQPPPKVDFGVPFLVISNVASGRISFQDTRFVPRKYFDAIQDKRKPRKGDLLLTVTGSYGIPVLVETDDEFCFQRHIALVRPDKIRAEYLRYFFLASKKYFDDVATGTAQKTVSLSFLRRMPVIALNAKAEEKVIAKLDEFDLRGRALHAAAKRGAALCEELRKSVLTEAFA